MNEEEKRRERAEFNRRLGKAAVETMRSEMAMEFDGAGDNALTASDLLPVHDYICQIEAERDQMAALAADITAQIERWLKATVEYTADWPQRAFNVDERILGGIADILQRARSAGVLPPLSADSSASGEIPHIDKRDA